MGPRLRAFFVFKRSPMKMEAILQVYIGIVGKHLIFFLFIFILSSFSLVRKKNKTKSKQVRAYRFVDEKIKLDIMEK